MATIDKLPKFSNEVWATTYKFKDEKSLRDTYTYRLAPALASNEKDKILEASGIERTRKEIQDKYTDILVNLEFCPGGRIIANLGTNGRSKTTLINCYVHCPSDIKLEDPDSINGIYHMLTAQAETLKSEGGYGTNFSYIRPAGAYIEGIDSRTPGVVAFMKMWDQSSTVVTSGFEGYIKERRESEKTKIRKGAQMFCLSGWHPEIHRFVRAKQVPGQLTKANMSVGITEGFMDAVKADDTWDLVFPDTKHPNYRKDWKGVLKHWKDKGNDVETWETIKARDLWDEIMLATYTRNEPGVIFLDLANLLDPCSYIEGNYIQATNPCGEIDMVTGICDIGSLVLPRFVQIKNGKPEIDWNRLAHAIKYGIRALDSIIDLSTYPLPDYETAAKQYRRIGLGVMGLGSLHFMLGIRYGSEESKRLTRDIFKFKAEHELLASSELGLEKGSFPLFDRHKYFQTYWWKNLDINPVIKAAIEANGAMRNSHRSMVAPTGNTGILCANVSGGIEPVFSKHYIRWAIVPEREIAELRTMGMEIPEKLLEGMKATQHLKVSKRGDEYILKGTFNGEIYEFDSNRGLTRSEKIEDYGWKWANENYSEEELDILQRKGVFLDVHELTPTEHLDIMGIAAHYTDMGISKTINCAHDISFEDFKDIYMGMYDRKIKGGTTYREGTMTVVLERESNLNPYEELFYSTPGTIVEDAILPDERFSGLSIIEDEINKWYLHTDFLDAERTVPIALWVNTNADYKDESTEITRSLISNIELLCIKAGVKRELVEDQSMKYSNQENVVRIVRAIGLALRHKVPIIDIVSVLDKYNKQISTFLYHLKKHLSKYIPDKELSGTTCPECQEQLIFQNGCKLCENCGYSIC